MYRRFVEKIIIISEKFIDLVWGCDENCFDKKVKNL